MKNIPLGLLALAIGGFGIGLTEFVIAGLLPEVAQAFGVNEAKAGGLISGYALAVAVGAIVLTLLLNAVPRKVALLGLLILFIAGNLISALAGTYSLMLTGRILAALCHGAFFGIGSVVAASMVAPSKQSGAIALMFGGLTTANVLGVPLGTLIGQAFGWRSTFWVITMIGIGAFVAIAALVPAMQSMSPQANSVERNESASVRIRRELYAFTRIQVLLSLLVTVLGFGGMFGAFTYISYILTGVSGFPSTWVPWLLVAFGVGLFAGNLYGGRAADRNNHMTILTVLVALVIVMSLFALTAQFKVTAVLFLMLMGLFGFAIVPGLQNRILSHAGDAPTLASGANIAAFNIGNAMGAWLSGLGISLGLGYASALWIGAGLSLVALIVFAISITLPGGRPRKPASAPTSEVVGGVSRQ